MLTIVVSEIKSRKDLIVIDDDDTMRKALSMILRNNGFFVREAGNGREAAGLIQASSPQLLISDLYLPDTTGLEIYREYSPRFPVLLITAFTNTPLAEKAKAEAGPFYMEKSFGSASLIEKISTILGFDQSRIPSIRLIPDIRNSPESGNDEIENVPKTNKEKNRWQKER